jgi:hypothetical protein
MASNPQRATQQIIGKLNAHRPKSIPCASRSRDGDARAPIGRHWRANTIRRRNGARAKTPAKASTLLWSRNWIAPHRGRVSRSTTAPAHPANVDVPQSGKVNCRAHLHLNDKIAPNTDGRQSSARSRPANISNRPGVGWSSEITTTVQDKRLMERQGRSTSRRLWLINGKPVQVSEDDAVELAIKSGLQVQNLWLDQRSR